MLPFNMGKIIYTITLLLLLPMFICFAALIYLSFLLFKWLTSDRSLPPTKMLAPPVYVCMLTKRFLRSPALHPPVIVCTRLMEQISQYHRPPAVHTVTRAITSSTTRCKQIPISSDRKTLEIDCSRATGRREHKHPSHPPHPSQDGEGSTANGTFQTVAPRLDELAIRPELFADAIISPTGFWSADGL